MGVLILYELNYTFMVYLTFRYPVIQNYYKMKFWVSNMARQLIPYSTHCLL